MTTLLFIALTWKVVDFVRLATDWRRQRSALLTQGIAWAISIGAVWVGGHAAIVSSKTIPGTSLPLAALDAGSIILVGLMIGSGTGVGVDFKQAIDGSDSAAKPSLLRVARRARRVAA